MSLSPEGGAHQSVITPASPSRCQHRYYEPAFCARVDMGWLLEALRAILDRGEEESSICGCPPSPWIRLSRAASSGSTRRAERRLPAVDARGEPGWIRGQRRPSFAAGVMVPEAMEAANALAATESWPACLSCEPGQALQGTARPTAISGGASHGRGGRRARRLGSRRHSHCLSFLAQRSVFPS